MDIIWHGYSCFSLKTKEATVLINPYNSEIGLKLPTLKPDVVLVSQQNAEIQPFSEVKILDWPGEYEVAGVAITAYELKKEKQSSLLFVLDIDNLKICYLTDLNIALSEEMIENIGEVDILMLPVGITKNIAHSPHEVIEKIEPRAVIPMSYKTDGLKIEVEGLDTFVKQVGLTNPESKEKFSVNAKSDLPEEHTEFIILNPQIA